MTCKHSDFNVNMSVNPVENSMIFFQAKLQCLGCLQYLKFHDKGGLSEDRITLQMFAELPNIEGVNPHIN